MRHSVLVLSLAFSLVACNGDASVPTTSTTTAPATTVAPTTTGATTTTTVPPSGTAFADAIEVGVPIRLASTHRVVNVDADDVLNARRLPGAGGPLVAELDPAYSTFRFTGETTEVPDGGTWAKIVLSDPAVQLVFDPEPWQVPWGWVNAFYMEPLAEWAPVNGSCDPDGGVSGYAGDPSSTFDQLMDLLLLDFGACSQLVVTLAAGDELDHLGTTLPAVTASVLPAGIVRLEIDPPDQGWLQVLWPATEIITPDLEVYTVRGTDGEIWIDIHGASQAAVEYLGDQGQLVVHLADGAPVGTERNETLVGAFFEAGPSTVSLWGYGRPFEAFFSAKVLDATDAVVAVPATGNSLWEPGSGAFGVGTTDWSETWGWWSIDLDISGLAPGDYRVVLADDGATEDAPTIIAPFTAP